MKKHCLHLQVAVWILVILCEGCNNQPVSTPSSTVENTTHWNGEGLHFIAPEPFTVVNHELPCPEPSLIVNGDTDNLQTILDNAEPNDVIAVRGHLKSDILISKPITLSGINQDGACFDLSGLEELPKLHSITVSPEGRGSVISGLHIVKTGVRLQGPATLRNIVISGGHTCLQIDAPSLISEFIVQGCHQGVQINQNSSLANGLVVQNTDEGIHVNATSKIHHMTIADNGGHGIVLNHGKTQLFNSLIVGNGGWGLYEIERAGMLEHLSFATNKSGHYGGTDINRSHPPLEWERERFIAITMTQGDRQGTEPALATTAIIRAELARKPPWKNRKKRKGLVSVIEQYTPGKHVQSSRAGYETPAVDLSGRKRRQNTCVGALEFPRKSPEKPSNLFVVSTALPNGNGSILAPFRTIQEAVDRSSTGDVINIFSGTYEETVLIQETALTLRGIKKVGKELVPVTSANDPEIPIIDPSETGTHEQALFLQDTLYGMKLEGLAIENALTGLTVIGRIDDVPPEPTIQSMRFSNNKKAMDADCGGGLLKNSLFEKNRVACTFRAGNHWKVDQNTFKGPGAGIVFSMLITHGYEGFEVSGNTFNQSGIYIDALHGRHGSSLRILKNNFNNSDLVVRHGSPTANLTIQENNFTGSGHLRMATSKTNSPSCTGCFTTKPCVGFCSEDEDELPGKIFPSSPLQHHSAPIAITRDGSHVIAVGADFGGVLIMETNGHQTTHIETGKDPRGVAIAESGRLALVTNLAAGTLSLIDLPEKKEITEIPVGIEPYGVVFSPNKKEAWVTLSGESALAIVDLEKKQVQEKVPLPKKPRGISLDQRNGKWQALITHFTPRHLPGKATATLESIEATLSISSKGSDGFWNVREIILPPVSSKHFPEAVPTLMQSVVVKGDRAYLPSFGATPHRPDDATFEGRPLLEFETSVQALLTVVDLNKEQVIESESANLNTPGRILNGPYGIAFSPTSPSEVLIPVYGNNAVARFHLFEGEKPRPVRAYRGSVDIFVGTNPRGVVYHPDGTRAYTVNFASGDLSVIQLKESQMEFRTPLGPKKHDRLSPLARRGKELFYTTQRVDTVADFWFACGTCHPDGRTDGITWRFSNGPRSTPIITASLDTLPLHFDADRDEFTDFEHTVRDLQGGFSLDRARLKPALGEPSSNKMAYGWKAMEAYIREGIDTPAAPTFEPSEIKEGELLFTQLKCDKCHGGVWFAPEPMGENPNISNGQITDTLHNVGTKSPADKIGNGAFDPPSLWGLHQTGPYLHDGSALTLYDVLKNKKHLNAGLSQKDHRELSETQIEQLVRYLTTITDGTPVP